MSELRPELIALLERAREAHSPSEADAARVQAALAAALGPAVIAPTTGQASLNDFVGSAQSAAPTAQVGAGASSGAWLAAKLVVGLAVSTLGVWAALPAPGARPSVAERPTPASPQVSAARATQREEPEHTALPAGGAMSDERVAASTEQRAAVHEVGLEIAPGSEGAQVAPAVTRRRRAAQRALSAASHALTAATPAPVAAPPLVAAAAASRVTVNAQKPVDRLGSARAELQLIRAAVSALNGRHADQALALLRRHRLEYPAGVMTEEREGLWSVASCEGGQLDEGRAAGQRFAARAPNSPLLERIRSACQGKGP